MKYHNAVESPGLARIRTQCAAAEEDLRVDGLWVGGTHAHTEYRDKPVEWIVEKLGVVEETIRWDMSPEYEGHVWDGTENPLVAGLEAIARNESIAVSAGTNTSKSFVLGACMTLWFLAVYENSIVLTIGPREKQLLKNLWKYVGVLWPKFLEHFPNAQLIGGTLRMLGDDPGVREKWTATAITAAIGADEEVAQNLAGFHQPEMLWIVEETPGVEMPIVNTILNTATGRWNPICFLGNPDHRHDTLGQMSAKDWIKSIRISGYDFPNVVTGRNIVDGAVTQESIDRRLSDAGGNDNDPIYLGRVRGIAPAQSRHAMILREWCEQAAARQSNDDLRKGLPALGVDPADSPTGDFSSISRWQGACCTEVSVFHAEDASEVGRMVFAEINDSNNPIDPRHVGIDAVGIGASTVNELKQLGVKIRLISGGMRAVPGVDTEERWSETEETEDGQLRPKGARVLDVGRYFNQRSQVFWRLREDLRLGRIAIPNDEKLFEELTVLEYKDENGKITVVPKLKLKEKLGRSPDRADALAYGNFVRPRKPAKKPPGEPKPKDRNHCDGLERIKADKGRRGHFKKRRYGGRRK